MVYSTGFYTLHDQYKRNILEGTIVYDRSNYSEDIYFFVTLHCDKPT